MNYYHFTKGCLLSSIVKDGIIETSKIKLEKREKLAVWLTKSPEWETACNIGKIINGDELKSGEVYSSDDIHSVTVTDDYMKKEIGMCRILISESLPVITWAKYRYKGGMSDRAYNAMDSYSRNIGCPVDEWICSFAPIPRKYWEGIEMFVDDQWVRWDEKMPIQEFIDLCLSCNGKQEEEEEMINGFPKKHAQKQVEFMKTHKDEIVRIWEANKHQNGYIEIYITPDYKPYPQGFKFIKKRVKKSTFKKLWESETNRYALVRFLWEATFTQYRMALAYETQEYASTDNSNHK